MYAISFFDLLFDVRVFVVLLLVLSNMEVHIFITLFRFMRRLNPKVWHKIRFHIIPLDSMAIAEELMERRMFLPYKVKYGLIRFVLLCCLDLRLFFVLEFYLSWKIWP